jgi:hypothetical protein
MHGCISKKEGCKVHIKAMLDYGGENYPVVYATLEGFSIDVVKLLDHEDKVAKRTWEVDVCKIPGWLQQITRFGVENGRINISCTVQTNVEAYGI